MKKITAFFMSLSILMLIACSPVKVSVKDQYQLSEYANKRLAKSAMPISILVTPPEAAAGYQTEQMLYIKKPFELDAFTKNSWISPPADMLYPLILQSLQKTNVFAAVTSNAYTLGVDYRLDTQLLSLNQNFLKKPSIIDFAVKAVLTRVKDNKVLASEIMSLHLPCPYDTPYGGVIAANRATQQFTANLAKFVAAEVNKEHSW